LDLIYGAGKLDRRVEGVEKLLHEWRMREADWGQLYLEFQPATPKDVLLVEDLAATMLINSRVAGQAAAAVYRNGSTLDLASWPDKPLEQTNADERRGLAELIGTMTTWPWVGASLATKTLHKKRPRLVRPRASSFPKQLRLYTIRILPRGGACEPPGVPSPPQVPLI